MYQKGHNYRWIYTSVVRVTDQLTTDNILLNMLHRQICLYQKGLINKSQQHVGAQYESAPWPG